VVEAGDAARLKLSYKASACVMRQSTPKVLQNNYTAPAKMAKARNNGGGANAIERVLM
jgi:hypothetical protein